MDYPTLLDFERREVPVMPAEFFGEVGKGCGYTDTPPRRWTERELEWIAGLKANGYTNAEIAQSVGRTETSISIKMKRLGKSCETYNDGHREEKYEANLAFYERCRPDSILDLYCGTESFWRNNTETYTFTNDIDKEIPADRHMAADKMIAELYSRDFRFDLIDLDPFGSAYDCFDLALKMARKAVIVTFGEMGHKRWKRLDFVRTHYGIDSVSDFTTQRLIDEFIRIGRRNKKEAQPGIVKEWPRISRVYFELTQIKTTEQWK